MVQLLRPGSLLLPSAPAGAADPNFASVVLLAGFDGTDAATSFSDESPAAHGAFTFGGAAALDTAQAKYGSASLLLPGASTDKLSLADHADWEFGSGDFTVECFVRWDVLPVAGNGYPVAHYRAFAGTRGWAIRREAATGAVVFGYSTTGSNNIDVSSGVDDGTIVDTWHHIAAVRESNTFRVFLDGAQTASASAVGVTIANPSIELSVGVLFDGGPLGAGNNAWVDELRITKGVGRYSGNFTPPTAKFPRQ